MPSPERSNSFITRNLSIKSRIFLISISLLITRLYTPHSTCNESRVWASKKQKSACCFSCLLLRWLFAVCVSNPELELRAEHVPRPRPALGTGTDNSIDSITIDIFMV